MRTKIQQEEIRLVRAATLALGIAAAIAAAPQKAWGQDVAPGQERFSLDLGGIANRFDTNVRLDGEGSRGTQIDLEGNTLERNLTSFEAALAWRIARDHRLTFRYFIAEREGSRTYSDTIDIDGEVFPVGANLAARVESTFLTADYRYSFARGPDYEWAVLAGIYGGRFTFDLTATGNVNGNVRTVHRVAETSLPLPMLGLTFDWYPDRHWRMSGVVSGIKAQIGDVDGHAFIGALSAEYIFTRHFGVGARYAYTDIEADVTKSGFNGNFSWRANGVSLYAKILF